MRLSKSCFIFESSWQASFTRKVMIGTAVLRMIRFEELLGCGVKIEQGRFTFDRLGDTQPSFIQY
jgi:hypothetical protein